MLHYDLQQNALRVFILKLFLLWYKKYNFNSLFNFNKINKSKNISSVIYNTLIKIFHVFTVMFQKMIFLCLLYKIKLTNKYKNAQTLQKEKLFYQKIVSVFGLTIQIKFKLKIN